MIIPHDQLSPETLRALIEEFVTRQGAVQGHSESTLDQKVAQVMAQLKLGKVAVIYDPDDETTTIAEKRTLGK